LENWLWKRLRDDDEVFCGWVSELCTFRI